MDSSIIYRPVPVGPMGGTVYRDGKAQNQKQNRHTDTKKSIGVIVGHRKGSILGSKSHFGGHMRSTSESIRGRQLCGASV